MEIWRKTYRMGWTRLVPLTSFKGMSNVSFHSSLSQIIIIRRIEITFHWRRNMSFYCQNSVKRGGGGKWKKILKLKKWRPLGKSGMTVIAYCHLDAVRTFEMMADASFCTLLAFENKSRLHCYLSLPSAFHPSGIFVFGCRIF